MVAARLPRRRDVWDDESLYVLSTSLVGLARQAGALAALPEALLVGMGAQLLVVSSQRLPRWRSKLRPSPGDG